MSLGDLLGTTGLGWAELALVLAFLAFAAVAVHTLFLRRREADQQASRLPLEDDRSDAEEDTR
ncbi:MAG: hypothetical protein KBD01_05085 [Acidobacteria bacterium]|nr:hypothetical protein [Acidobacteriota bacterium]